MKVPPSWLILNESEIAQKMLSNFITLNTGRFLGSVDINQDFLLQDTCTWNIKEEYNKAFRTVQKIKVVNEFVERGFALTQNFNSVINNQEELKQ